MKRRWGAEFTPLASKFFTIASIIVGMVFLATVIGRLILKRYK